MALRRSLMNMAERADVQPALKKLWKKHYKVDGQVTQHLSPFEQSILGPLFKNLIPNTIKRIKNFVIVAGPGLGSGAFAYYYCEWKYKDLAYHHRS
eukprot:gene22217-25174_t